MSATFSTITDATQMQHRCNIASVHVVRPSRTEMQHATQMQHRCNIDATRGFDVACVFVGEVGSFARDRVIIDVSRSLFWFYLHPRESMPPELWYRTPHSRNAQGSPPSEAPVRHRLHFFECINTPCTTLFLCYVETLNASLMSSNNLLHEAVL